MHRSEAEGRFGEAEPAAMTRPKVASQSEVARGLRSCVCARAQTIGVEFRAVTFRTRVYSWTRRHKGRARIWLPIPSPTPTQPARRNVFLVWVELRLMNVAVAEVRYRPYSADFVREFVFALVLANFPVDTRENSGENEGGDVMKRPKRVSP